jgi:hypothetical protein
MRNIAFYRAGWHRTVPRVKTPFWVNANSNCIDVAVLEWCKLFAERNGRHHWKTAVTDRECFRAELVTVLGVSWADFSQYAINVVLKYRDSFVAHLDDDNTMHVPSLRMMRVSVAFLYRYILDVEAPPGLLVDAPPPGQLYSFLFRHAREQYARAM